MLKFAAKTLASMLSNCSRMPGRSWSTEYFARLNRAIIDEAAVQPISWSRELGDSIKIPHAALKQVDFETIEVAGVSCLQVSPQQLDDARIVVYLHGGAYITGSPTSYKTLAARIAVASKTRVIVPDYRLSPEHAFPAAQDDCVAVVEYVRQAYPEAVLVVVGDSAGGALAVNTALCLAGNRSEQAVDEEPTTADIQALVLISPWVEPTSDTGSMRTNDLNDIFSRAFLAQSYRAHMQEANLFDVRSNYLNADLSVLPPTYIQVAGGELFLDQVSQFSERARSQGAPVELEVFPAQFHVFQQLGPTLKDAGLAINKIADFIATIAR